MNESNPSRFGHTLSVQSIESSVYLIFCSVSVCPNTNNPPYPPPKAGTGTADRRATRIRRWRRHRPSTSVRRPTTSPAPHRRASKPAPHSRSHSHSHLHTYIHTHPHKKRDNSGTASRRTSARTRKRTDGQTVGRRQRRSF